jgi:hypothetical protein
VRRHRSTSLAANAGNSSAGNVIHRTVARAGIGNSNL